MSDYVQALHAVDAAVARHGFEIGAVSHPIAVVYLVGRLEYEVAGGGVVQWLTNRSGRYAALTVAALTEIGAEKCASIVDRIIQTLGAGTDFADDAQRVAAVQRVAASAQAAWRDLADELLDWPDDIDALLRSYVAANRMEFS